MDSKNQKDPQAEGNRSSSETQSQEKAKAADLRLNFTIDFDEVLSVSVPSAEVFTSSTEA